MSEEAGYTRFCCDRSEKAHKDKKRPEVYLLKEDKARANWHTITWIDINGVEMHQTLCEDCYKAYQDIQKQHAKTMRDFMYKNL